MKKEEWFEGWDKNFDTQNIAYDFLGNPFKVGDDVICVMGKHLRKSVVSKITFYGNYIFIENKIYPSHNIQIKGLKESMYSNFIMTIPKNN